MRLYRLNGDDCDDWPACPAVFDTDGSDILVQGLEVTDPAVLAETMTGPGERLVAIPRDKFQEAITRLAKRC